MPVVPVPDLTKLCQLIERIAGCGPPWRGYAVTLTRNAPAATQGEGRRAVTKPKLTSRIYQRVPKGSPLSPASKAGDTLEPRTTTRVAEFIQRSNLRSKMADEETQAGSPPVVVPNSIEQSLRGHFERILLISEEAAAANLVLLSAK